MTNASIKHLNFNQIKGSVVDVWVITRMFLSSTIWLH